MTGEQLKKLAIGLGVLVVLWAGLTFYRRAGTDRAETLRLTRFDPAAVTAVTIARATDTVALARNGADWTVNGHPAAADLVTAFLKNAADTGTIGELVAENKGSHGRLGVDAAKAKRVTITAGGKAAAVYLVGNRGDGFEAVFLRREGEDRVWSVKNGLVEGVERAPDDWRDKRILAVAADSIGGLDITRGKTGYSVDRNGAGWSLGKAPADSGAVGRLLGQFAALTAAGFPTRSQADSADFTKPARSIRLRDKAGRPIVQLALDSVAGGFLVRKEGQPVIFRIDGYLADQLAPADSTLRAKTVPPAKGK